MAPLSYQPSDWYWFIGGDTTKVWSSARAMSVPATDAGYVAWLNGGAQPANAATMTDLEATLALVFPPGTPRTYAADARYRKASGGMIITSLSAVPFFTDPLSRNTVNSAWDYMNAKGTGNSIDWKMSDGSFILLSTTQMNAVMNDMSVFVQSCFTCEANLNAGIADGSITTLAQIDAAFAAISNVFP